jgi:hypothetical protein
MKTAWHARLQVVFIAILIAAVFRGEAAMSASYSLSGEVLLSSHARATSESYQVNSTLDPMGGFWSSTSYELASGLPLRLAIVEFTPPILIPLRYDSPNIEFLVTGVVGARAAIEHSADLKTWDRVQTNIIVQGGAQVISRAAAASGFYRAILVE